MLNMKKSILFLFVSFTLVALQSCQQEEVIEIPENLVVPQIPPMELYTMPTDKIAHADSLITNDSRNGTKTNWIHAGVSLLVWNSVVVINLAGPVSAVGLAFNQNAQYIGNNTFEWTYQYNAPPHLGGGFFDVSLTGEYINNFEDVQWTLTASQPGSFTNFVWFSGVVSTDLTSAQFQINQNPNNPSSYLLVDTEREINGNEIAVRFTNDIAGDPGFGHFIEYTASNIQLYNRAFQLNAGPTNILDIEWNDPQGDGRVRHERRFGDTDWHCWNTQQFDVDCN